MANILTEQDTMFGSIAFRNKLITKEQLSEAVMQTQAHPGVRLGEVLQKMGSMTEEQVQAVLDMQSGQREKLQAQQPPSQSQAASQEAAPAMPEAQGSQVPQPPPVQPAGEVQGFQRKMQLPPQEEEATQEEPAVEAEQEVGAQGPTLEDALAEAEAALEEHAAETPVEAEPEQSQASTGPSALDIDFSMPGFGGGAQAEPTSEEVTSAPLAGDSLFVDDSAQEALEVGQVDFEDEVTRPAVEAPVEETLPVQEAPAAQDQAVAEAQAAPVPETAQPQEPAVEVGPGAAVEGTSLFDYLAMVRNTGASDLHISAEVRPFVRKAGRLEMLDAPVLPAVQTEALVFSALSQEQKAHLVQNNSLEFCLDVPGEGRYRSTIIKQRCGYDGIFRVIRGAVPSMRELGLPDSLNLLTEYNQGLVLVTGPGNSGKTTTLAALLDAINKERSDHIITVEHPVEYLHTPKMCQVTQREVGVHTESFSVALRAALREDPDVIMVGELHDLETLSMAITASETGHLVFGTLHTTSATSTVGRVVDAFPVGQQAQIRMMVSESLRGILSQQLVPRKEGGVALALEILFVTPAVSALIRDNQPHQITSVMQTSRKMGMCRMDDSLMELVNQGVIDGAEAYRRADNKQTFKMYQQTDM